MGLELGVQTDEESGAVQDEELTTKEVESEMFASVQPLMIKRRTKV